MPDIDTDQMSISLGAQLFLTHFVAAGTGLMVFTLMWQSSWLGKTAVSLTVAGVIGLLLNVNIQRTLRLVDWTVRRLGEALSVDAIPAGWHGPLVGFVAHVQRLVAQERPLTDIRVRELQQASELAAEEERQRLARDLHDSIKQQLFSIQVSAAAAQARWDDDVEGAKTAVSDVRNSAKAALVEVNALLQQLAQHPLKTIGLAQALREQADALAYRSGANVDTNIMPLPDNEQFPPANRKALFRIAQEAMGNIARHARAQHVTISLQADAHQIELQIADNGQGFNTANVPTGMGLANMQKRADDSGGTLRIDTNPGKGTTIRFTLPLIENIAAKERKMQKPNHTINHVGIVGLLGGVVASTALIYPLYIVLPGRYLAEWPSGSSTVGLVFDLIAALLIVGTGYFAVKQAAKNGYRQILWGAVAGGIAGAVAFILIIGAAMTILGSAGLLEHGLVQSETEGEFMLLLVNVTAGVMWWIAIGFWLVLVGSVLLGMLGGWVAWRRVEKRPSASTSLLPVAATVLFAGTLSSLVTVTITTAITALLGPQVAKAASDLNWTQGSLTVFRMVKGTVNELGGFGQGEVVGVQYPPMGASIMPMLATGLLYVSVMIALYVVIRQLARSQEKSDQRHALVIAYMTGIFAGLGIPVLLLLVQDVLLRNMMFGICFVMWVTALLFLRCAQQIERTFEPQSGEMPQNLYWLRSSPLLMTVFVFPLTLMGQEGVAFWVLAITAVLVTIFVRRDWHGTNGANTLSYFMSALWGGGLAYALPMTVLISSALGLISLAVFAIPWITSKP
ncbi:MAG: sensor histidine kinase, partial [Anaerolineales bacterium]|nr:sensor histidine kinase [Anaerolineales bacterium]